MVEVMGVGENDGPDAQSVVNAAPWILTVGATTIDRYFESDVVLGGNKKAVKAFFLPLSALKFASFSFIKQVFYNSRTCLGSI